MTKEPKVAAAPREPGALRGTRWGEGLWSIVRELNRRGLEPRFREPQPPAAAPRSEPGQSL